MNTYTDFSRKGIPLIRVFALAELITECQILGVKIKNVFFFQNGFQVYFENCDGDAIIHDNSYGCSYGLWETFRFPWDDHDVTVHDSKELAKLVSELQKGE